MLPYFDALAVRVVQVLVVGVVHALAAELEGDGVDVLASFFRMTLEVMEGEMAAEVGGYLDQGFGD